ncbi:hypothetical protein IWQ61_010574 [Dispira simplex]|nr:hypothetical protein IWQ61_010574 [Dispira simplex]
MQYLAAPLELTNLLSPRHPADIGGHKDQKTAHGPQRDHPPGGGTTAPWLDTIHSVLTKLRDLEQMLTLQRVQNQELHREHNQACTATAKQLQQEWDSSVFSKVETCTQEWASMRETVQRVDQTITRQLTQAPNYLEKKVDELRKQCNTRLDQGILHLVNIDNRCQTFEKKRSELEQNLTTITQTVQQTHEQLSTMSVAINQTLHCLYESQQVLVQQQTTIIQALTQIQTITTPRKPAR